MKESQFIEQNKEKWQYIENNLQTKDSNPSETSKLFIQITDDLSYARTFYNNRSVKLYLNGLAKLLFNDINKSRKNGLKTFVNFWKTEFPLSIYMARRPMLISFVVFVSCFILGVLTSIHDKNFASSILSNDYINMTKENIAKGDAMAVYKSSSEMRTFLPILLNNLSVEFLTFFTGIFMAIGSLVVMVINGVMVGTFQYFFIERGLFWPSFLSIWTHGTLEITTIILSGGAGLTLGKGLLFPGTYSRGQAFKLSGKNGIKIIIGVVPFIFIAAFIEGFITRHTNVPDFIRFLFILSSFFFVLFYFFYYPRKIGKLKQQEKDEKEIEFLYKQSAEFDHTAIYSTNKVITESFRLFFKNSSFCIKLLLGVSLANACLIAYNPFEFFHSNDDHEFLLPYFFNYTQYPMMAVLALFSFFIISFFLNKYFKTTLVNKQPISMQYPIQSFKAGVIILFVLLLFESLIYIEVEFTSIISHVLFPFYVFITCLVFYENNSFENNLNSARLLLSSSFIKFMVTVATFCLIAFICYLTSFYAVKWLMLKDAVVWVLTDDDALTDKIMMAFQAFQTSFSFFLYLMFLIIASHILYFTLKETRTASHLISKIKSISKQK